MLMYLKDNKPDLEELNMLVIPVERTTQTDYYGYLTSAALNNYLQPSGVRLRKDQEALRFQIISSKYDTD
jgi:hypothetical protein